MDLNKITHITYTDIDEFINILQVLKNDKCCGDKVVNDVMMDDSYILTFLDEGVNIYYRLVIKTFEQHDIALKKICKIGYLVVVI